MTTIRRRTFQTLLAGACLALVGCAIAPWPRVTSTRAIIFVWDGLRPDSVSQAETPNLWSLRQSGVWFDDNHSTYPTFTMMNASALATGSFPATTGFYGNTLWQPGPHGKDAAGKAVDFNQPVFTEDWSVLDALDAYYLNHLYLVQTLFQAAQRKGLVTATIGKTGASYIQDYKRGGFTLDENLVAPQSLARELQAAGFAIPKNSPNGYPAGALTLAAANGDPTGQTPTAAALSPNGLRNGDPTASRGAKATAANEYMMNVYLRYILPNKKPDLSIVWFRDPDTTEHAYGPGSGNYHLALRAQDQRLGELLATLRALGLQESTNVVVVSDHGHTTVSGPPALFPLRSISQGKVGESNTAGYSVSGDVRTAELLSRAKIDVAPYDGRGCLSSALSGLKADGSWVYPVLTDGDGSICGKAGTTYQTRRYTVPEVLPANAVVIAANGGSEYLYVPSHDPDLVARLVRFLQTRSEYGAIFVASRYGALAGTISMANVKVEGTSNRSPDIVVSFDDDPNVVVAGMPGIEFESFSGNRGMHGSFGTADVHNTLIAAGPDFKVGAVSTIPSGNVDVAPTIAYLLGSSMPEADGRVLYEALRAPPAGVGAASVTRGVIEPPGGAVVGLKFQLPTQADGGDVDPRKTGRYSVKVLTKDVRTEGRTYRYFDSAKASRE